MKSRDMVLQLLGVMFLLVDGGGPGQPLPIIKAPTDSPLDCPSKRPLTRIVSGCFVTTFLCAWVAVHPNIPPPGEFGWKAAWRRTKLMFWALVAPELILAWAVKQRYAAQEIADTYNEIKGLKPNERSFIGEWLAGHKKPRGKAWTRIHGHFLIMGGFVLTEPEASKDELAGNNSNFPYPSVVAQTAEALDVPTESDDIRQAVLPVSETQGPCLAESWSPLPKHILYPPRSSAVPSNAQTPALPESQGRQPIPPMSHVLTYQMLEKLITMNDLDFEISITEEEIQDRSKGDILAKLVAGLQVFWFISQCLVRWPQRLEVTQLELITLALASLNAVMYGFWIEKPLDVAVPARVNLKRRMTAEERLRVCDPDPREPLFQLLIDRRVLIQEGQNDIWRSIPRIIRSIPSQRAQAVRHPRRLLHRWFIALPFRVLLLFANLATFSPSAHLTVSLFRIVFTSNIRIHALHVPTFYCPRTKNVSNLHLLVLMVGGTIFSCLHHLGPHLTTFPSPNERALWSVMSYCMMVGLLSGVTIAYFLSILQRKLKGSRTTGSILITFLVVLELYALLLVIVGRLALIFLALVLLREQPGSAFCAVDWTKLIPHIS